MCSADKTPMCVLRGCSPTVSKEIGGITCTSDRKKVNSSCLTYICPDAFLITDTKNSKGRLWWGAVSHRICRMGSARLRFSPVLDTFCDWCFFGDDHGVASHRSGKRFSPQDGCGVLPMEKVFEATDRDIFLGVCQTENYVCAYSGGVAALAMGRFVTILKPFSKMAGKTLQRVSKRQLPG